MGREFSGITRTVPWAHLLCVHVLCVYKKLLELLFLFSVIFSLFNLYLYFIMKIKCIFGLYIMVHAQLMVDEGRQEESNAERKES